MVMGDGESQVIPTPQPMKVNISMTRNMVKELIPGKVAATIKVPSIMTRDMAMERCIG